MCVFSCVVPVEGGDAWVVYLTVGVVVLSSGRVKRPAEEEEGAPL